MVIDENIIWMKVESAEMTKHALNAFLATSVVFINELAVLCEHVGASANEVEQGLKSELRIGQKAYLRPGSAFDGGTLARDVTYLVEKEMEHNLSTIFFSSILKSNENHKSWVVNKIAAELPSLKDKKIGILGLTYKPGTDTLRRSTAIEICNLLHKKGAKISAFDPAIKNLPSNLENFIEFNDIQISLIITNDKGNEIKNPDRLFEIQSKFLDFETVNGVLKPKAKPIFFSDCENNYKKTGDYNDSKLINAYKGVRFQARHCSVDYMDQ